MPVAGPAQGPRIFVSACEASADLHGGFLIEALRKREQHASFTGIGGERMRAHGFSPVAHLKDLSAMGISEVLGRLPAYRSAFGKAVRLFDSGKVDVAVLIDSPDFNLRLAARAKRAGIPVVYFIAPKVWAWRRGRLDTIARRVDHMLVILPFEVPIYAAAGVAATYVGNPLVDEMARTRARAPFAGRWRPSDLGMDDDRPLVGLLPGSRPREISGILPDLLETARLLAKRLPRVQFALPIAPSLDGDAVRAMVSAAGVPVRCLEGQAVELMTAADAVAVASGTATLQAALADAPGVIVYRVAPLTYLVGRLLVRVPHIGLVNLVAEERVMPELLQGEFTPQLVCDHLFRILIDSHVARAQRDGLKHVRELLGGPGAPDRAAEIVLSVLGKKVA